jgi:hypothetical protein
MSKYKYVVAVTTINIDGDGNHKTEQFDTPFTDGDLPTMRREAFEKANDLTKFFENEMSKGHEFDSALVAELKGYRNVNGYSIDIIFFIDDLDYPIEGDYELQEEMMEVEELEFIKNGFEYPFEIPKYSDDDANLESVQEMINELNTTQRHNIDFTVDYDFDRMEKEIKEDAKEMSVSVNKYLKDGKKEFKNLGIAIIDEMTKSNNHEYIAEMIEDYNDARCKLELYQRFESDRKLKKGIFKQTKL